jgi:hypothetical protein
MNKPTRVEPKSALPWGTPMPLVKDVNGLFFNVTAIETMGLENPDPPMPGCVVLSVVFRGTNDAPRSRLDQRLRSYFVVTFEQLQWIEANFVGCKPGRRVEGS